MPCRHRKKPDVRCQPNLADELNKQKMTAVADGAWTAGKCADRERQKSKEKDDAGEPPALRQIRAKKYE